MILTIHQPEHLVWLGLIDKIAQADFCVILDTVQFEKNYFQNRNKIRTAKGWDWVSVPVQKHSLAASIRDIRIAGDAWKDSVLGKLRASYQKAPFFKTYFPELERIYRSASASLADLNIELLRFALDAFEVRTPLKRASEQAESFEGEKSELILDINKKLGAEMYIAGPTGRDYLHLDNFKRAGIQVRFHNFEHPVYTQLHGEFMPYMAFVDMLFNHGPHSAEILIKNRHELLSE